MPPESSVNQHGEPTVWSVYPDSDVDGRRSRVTDLHAWYGVPRPTRHDRPWTALNMITSIDGSVAVDGTSGGLGNATDRRVLGALRSAASMILVGAGTAAGEGYGPPRKAGQRIAVVTNSGRLDANSQLFASGAGFAVTHADALVPEGIEVLRAGRDAVDLELALHQLTAMVPVNGWIVVEGGPSLNGALLASDLIDEFNLTTAPFMVGGDGKRATSGAPEMTRSFELAHQLIDSDRYLFSRWVRRDRGDRRPS
ncbi:MAG TPA: dihydrofolate reductase family protein [Ilumatobacter sp.]|nr:dihydrofolate reductase family protein [Ilumatobacter sp.]